MQTTLNPLAALVQAVAFAADKHRNQRRKDAEAAPYINHPIALANEGGVQDVTVLCATVLHDTIEDTETTTDGLRPLFGEQVASVVLEVTGDKSLEKSVRKQQIAHAPHISPQAPLIKLISNLRDILASPPPISHPNANRLTSTRPPTWWPACAACTPGLEAVFDGLYARRLGLA
jgi:guanosine-3',5'-bis(diphosphate) 3'-pyrophosphohydrolase